MIIHQLQSMDPNMNTAYGWADELDSPQTLPSSLQFCIQRAALVQFIDNNLIRGEANLWEFDLNQKIEFLKKVANGTEHHIYDVEEETNRVNLALRLWTGCMEAAKMIRETYVIMCPGGSISEEKITPEIRRQIFVDHVDPRTRSDPTYLAGVEAALVLRGRFRKQRLFLEGVPADSPLMKYFIQFLIILFPIVLA